MSRSTLPLPASADPAAWLGVSLGACDRARPGTKGDTVTPDTDRLALIACQLQAVVGSQALAQAGCDVATRASAISRSTY